MTIHEVATQLFQLSNGNINGEQFSPAELSRFLGQFFRKGMSLKLGDRVILQIALPDGEWYFQITHYNDKIDGFDYYIPDTREQEQMLWDELMA